MPVFLPLFFPVVLSVAELFFCQYTAVREPTTSGRSYFLNNCGNDANDGSKTKPWKTITKLNSVQLNPGDSVLFTGGQTFSGSILLDINDKGSKEKPIVLSSAGNTNATIDAGGAAARLRG